MTLSFAGALLAGMLTFLSPCVLPLVISYLGFLAGVTVDAAPGGAVVRVPHRGRVIAAAAAFVLGFATVFTLLGATANWVSQALAAWRDVVEVAAGLILVVFGLHLAGVLNIDLLNLEKRLQVQEKPTSLAGAYVVGLAFAFGWTPCVGPQLAAALTLAAASDSVWRGAALLFTYALGLGIPFLLAAAFATRFLRFLDHVRRYFRVVKIAAGGLLIVTGLMVATGSFQRLSVWLQVSLPDPSTWW